jgi:hypothetical protein
MAAWKDDNWAVDWAVLRAAVKVVARAVRWVVGWADLTAATRVASLVAMTAVWWAGETVGSWVVPTAVQMVG